MNHQGTVRYGLTPAEKATEENNVCRQIVREIDNFGINQRQTMYIIYLLALQLEDNAKMRAITHLVRELSTEDTFIIGKMEPDVEIIEP